MRGVLDWQACERLQCRAANQLSKCACKGGLGPEEIKPSEHAADAVNQANLLGLRLEDAEKVIDVTGPAIETVAEGAGWRGGTKRKKRLADAIPHRTLIGKAQPAFLEVLGDGNSLAVADIRVQDASWRRKTELRVSPTACLDTAHRDHDLRLWRHQHSDVDDAILLGPDELFSVKDQHRSVTGILHT